MSVGSRKFGSSSISPLLRSMLSGWTWLLSVQGRTYSRSFQPQSRSVG